MLELGVVNSYLLCKTVAEGWGQVLTLSCEAPRLGR